ncbi:MAG: hypothetical protein IKS28_06185 [Clostridia bacterium]|nr:hypothetical protein [Clostridia bacterium]
MAVLRCKNCGGELEKRENGFYKCLFCGTIQSLDYDSNSINAFISSNAIENVYISATQAIATGKYDDAIKLLSTIHGYKDTDKRIEHCKEAILANSSKSIYERACDLLTVADSENDYRQIADLLSKIPNYRDSSALLSKAVKQADLLHKEETYKRACSLIDEGNIHFISHARELFSEIPEYKDSSQKKEHCSLLIQKLEKEIGVRNKQIREKRLSNKRKRRFIILAVIITIVTGIVTKEIISRAIHSPQDIVIEITNITPKSDDSTYYVYFDFLLMNNTGSTLDYLSVTTYFEDKSGKSLGTMTSEFGSNYGGAQLSLASGKQITKEIYLSDRKTSSHSQLFVKLYEEGLDSVVIRYEITCAKWLDGFTYKR